MSPEILVAAGTSLFDRIRWCAHRGGKAAFLVCLPRRGLPNAHLDPSLSRSILSTPLHALPFISLEMLNILRTLRSRKARAVGVLVLGSPLFLGIVAHSAEPLSLTGQLTDLGRQALAQGQAE